MKQALGGKINSFCHTHARLEVCGGFCSNFSEPPLIVLPALAAPPLLICNVHRTVAPKRGHFMFPCEPPDYPEVWKQSFRLSSGHVRAVNPGRNLICSNFIPACRDANNLLSGSWNMRSFWRSWWWFVHKPSSPPRHPPVILHHLHYVGGLKVQTAGFSCISTMRVHFLSLPHGGH